MDRKRKLPCGCDPCKKIHLDEDTIYRSFEATDPSKTTRELGERHQIAERKTNYVCKIEECSEEFEFQSCYEFHCNTVHKNICSICRRTFTSDHLLGIHIQEWHDSMFQVLAEKQPMYECLEVKCKEKFWNNKGRKKHMIIQHQYSTTYRFDKLKKREENRPTNDSIDSIAWQKLSSKDGLVTDLTKDAKSYTDEDKILSNGDKIPLSSHSCSDSLPECTASSKPVGPTRNYTYKVPTNICFGTGSQRGFYRKRGGGRGNKSRHWHQTEEPMNTSVDIEQVKMDDLASALDS